MVFADVIAVLYSLYQLLSSSVRRDDEATETSPLTVANPQNAQQRLYHFLAFSLLCPTDVLILAITCQLPHYASNVVTLPLVVVQNIVTSICGSVCKHMSGTIGLNFVRFSVHVTYGRSSTLLWRR